MPDPTDQSYLLDSQYRDASNLNARIRLHELYSVRPRPLHGWIFDRIKEREGEGLRRILELGCGPGTLWVSNLDRMPEAWDVTLSDFSPGMVEEAGRNLVSHRDRFNFMQIDAQSIPFPDGTFDVVIANYMLYHVPDRAQAIGEMARVLRPGGRLYTATPGLGHMRELNEILHGIDPDAEPVGEPLISSFALENGREQLESHFSRVEVLRFEDGQEDGLVVTEAGPLADYILSTSYSERAGAWDRRRIVAYLENLMGKRGAIRISKVSGMFVAEKAA
jgi:ubiquinone/menaquinone biosynthesis C-methylase UbiE